MEGLPSGDIPAKYQKLASEYSKLRVHVKVLKKGVLDEQAKSNELRETLKEREKSLRKGELEIDSLTFRNQQLTRRVSVLQDELEAFQLKLTKKKGKNDEKHPSTSNAAPLDTGLLQEELQKKIIENAQFASQLSDRSFEVSQLKASLEDYHKHISDSDSKYKCEIAKLRNRNQELQLALEEAQKERLSGTPSKAHLGSQAASCNGDFLSEGGSLYKCEIAKLRNRNQELQLALEEAQKDLLSGTPSKAHLGSQAASCNGDFLSEGGSLCEIAKLRNRNQELQLALEEVQKDRLSGTPSKAHLGSQAATCNGDLLQFGKHHSNSKYKFEIAKLRNKNQELQLALEELGSEDALSSVDDLNVNEQLSMKAHNLEQENQKLRMEYGMLQLENESLALEVARHMSVLTEHVAGLNEQLTKQHDEIQHLKHQLSTRRK
ncbi:Uncharacterized protein OBRU01_17450 [Operophtera brumata]|uniref:Protein phosphatase 1 regulatory subunit 21 N-terminal domain-containing protein n=1 Tax=Operophtera brumata TaxID=104452 RepID=A0A0L7L0X1_OPEBR|nr:Uncharacterized protein OBRU01_17450 [Operophtera brumata]